MSVDVLTSSMTNEMRAACKRLWGRGPEYVRILLAHEDTIVVLLTGILTDAERSLLAVDCDRAVVAQRAALHDALEPEIRVILETHLGRQTEAFISGIDAARDMASLVVTLR